MWGGGRLGGQEACLSEIFLQKWSPNNQFVGVLEGDNVFSEKGGGEKLCPLEVTVERALF